MTRTTVDKTEERINGKTTHGGTYSIFYYQNKNGQPADKAKAVRAEVVEFNAKDEQVWRTYADINP